MNTRSFVRAFTSCAAAALMACGTAHAATINGSVYTTAPFPAPLSGSVPPPGTFLGSFTTNGIDGFSAGGTNYTVGGFLTSQGNTVSGLSSTVAGTTLNNIELMFTGQALLTAGTTYTVTHDDGAILYLNGALALNSPGPTAPETSTFTVSTTGVYNFDLLYAEVNGAPATLNFDAPFTNVTPEPSTFMLLGTGLLTAAGAVRRRLRA